MAFVRAKHSGKRTYYQLVESRREDGKVRQRIIAYLGHYTSVEEALGALPVAIERNEQRAREWAAKAEAKLEQIPQIWIDRNGGEPPSGRGRGIALRRSICAQYWNARHFSEGAKRRAEEQKLQLAKLEALLEAGTIVATSEGIEAQRIATLEAQAQRESVLRAHMQALAAAMGKGV